MDNWREINYRLVSKGEFKVIFSHLLGNCKGVLIFPIRFRLYTANSGRVLKNLIILFVT